MYYSYHTMQNDIERDYYAWDGHYSALQSLEYPELSDPDVRRYVAHALKRRESDLLRKERSYQKERAETEPKEAAVKAPTTVVGSGDIVIEVSVEKILLWICFLLLIYVIYLGHSLLFSFEKLFNLQMLNLNSKLNSTTA